MKKFFQPWAVTLVLYLFYLGAILAAHNGDPIALVRLGHGPNEGYDGQFTYLIAINPVPESVVEEIQSVRADVPAYRYQRILLPLLARLFGLGQAGLIVWTIPLINLIAQTAGVAVVEQLLVQLGASRWYALVYGLWPGLAVAVRADLTEPLAYLLVAIGYLFHWRNRPWLSALSFGLAILAKETAILFAVAQLGYALLARDGRRAAALIGLAVLPFGVWQLILKFLFGTFGLGSGGYLGTPFEIVPFNGLWRILPDKGLTVFIVFLLFLGPWVMLPSIWGIIAAVRETWRRVPHSPRMPVPGLEGQAGRRNWHPYVWALGINAAIIPFIPYSTFREPVAMFRFCTGLVLATLLYGGLIQSRRVLNYSWFWLAMWVFLVKD